MEHQSSFSKIEPSTTARPRAAMVETKLKTTKIKLDITESPDEIPFCATGFPSDRVSSLSQVFFFYESRPLAVDHTSKAMGHTKTVTAFIFHRMENWAFVRTVEVEGRTSWVQQSHLNDPTMVSTQPRFYCTTSSWCSETVQYQ